jgi:hypothetical protein
MKHELKRERAGKAEMGSITPTCSCGWRGRTEYAYNDYCHTNVKEQEGDHIRNAHRGELETANATLEQQMMDACAPKNEREWWAFAEIGRLRAEVEALKAENERQFTALNDWLYANGPNGWIDLLRHELAAMTTEVEALRADAALKRDLLLWALYHAQGGSSRVGQAIRRHLGIEQHARLTPEQIKDAERAAQEGRG